MKEITAIVRMNMMNKTKRALSEAGVVSFTARKVMGRGKGKVDYLLLQGAKEGYEEAITQLGPGPKLIPKRMLTLIVPDALVAPAVEAVIRVNQTHSPGDGKIFVSPVAEAIRVRTGEAGEGVLDEATNEPALQE
ncbi:MAG: P-II family nitrogen regulator [Phycisphaerae bacterium]